MPELKPCPFCGQTNPEYITPYENGKHPYVMCPTCLASTIDNGDVVALWNARPPESDTLLLRAALKRLVYEVTHLSPLEEDGSHRCRIGRQALNQARDALAQSPAMTRPDGGDSTLREALASLIAKTDCIKHWHDAMGDEGAVISKKAMFDLWDEIEKARAALGVAKDGE